MQKLSIAQRAYIAGFIDGDGSIYVQLKPNKTYRFRYQVAPYIVLFQSRKERTGLERLHAILGIGYLRNRNDGIVEYIIGDVASIKALLSTILPYLVLKKRQANIMLAILRQKKRIKNGLDFLKLCQLVDQFQKLNYSKRRIQTYAMVYNTLQLEGIVTP